MELDPSEVSVDGARCASVGRAHRLAIVSWSELLKRLEQAIRESGNEVQLNNVRQFKELCAQMDEDAFSPIRVEELAVPEFAQRARQFALLVDEVVDAAIDDGLCTKEGRGENGPGYNGRYITIGGTGVLLHFDLRKWWQFESTPLWLRIDGLEWKNWQSSRDLLVQLEHEEPPRLWIDDNRGDPRPVIPLYLKTGVEKDQVVEHLVDQVRHVHDLLCKPSDSGDSQNMSNASYSADRISWSLHPLSDQSHVNTRSTA